MQRAARAAVKNETITAAHVIGASNAAPHDPHAPIDSVLASGK